MSLDGPEVSEVSRDVPVHSLTGTNNGTQVTHMATKRHKKKRKFLSDMKSSALRSERKRSYKILEEVLFAKQQALNDQQCRLDYLQNKMCILQADNRFLKEKGNVQAAIIERLDGKNAKVPMLISSQMEEIRAYREQLKRLKEVFIRTNKAMQESENARYKAEEELQHLRNLAFEQNLPEREELIAAVENLKADLESVEKEKMALEKYVYNLEKNQKYERARLLRIQKELQANCSDLTSTVHDLQLNLQEKQKMLDVQAMHIQRIKGHTMRNSVGTLTNIVGDSSAGLSDFEGTTYCKQRTPLESLPPPHLPKASIQAKSSRRESSKNEASPKQKAIYMEADSQAKPAVVREEPTESTAPLPSDSPCMTHKKKEASDNSSRPVTSRRGQVRCAPANTTSRPPTTDLPIFVPSVAGLIDSSFEENRGQSLDPSDRKDFTFAVLQASENLARLVAKAKIPEETGLAINSDEPKELQESGSEVVEERSCEDNHVTAVVSPQAYEDWPELEVVEPLRHQPMPKPVQVKNEIQTVAARGDSPEVSELLQKMPNRSKCQVSNPPKPSTVITNLIREVLRGELGEGSEQVEFEPQRGTPQLERASSRSSGGASRLNKSAPQEHTAEVQKRSIQTNRSCYRPLLTTSRPKAGQDGSHRASKQPPKAQQSARLSRKVPPVWPKYQTPRSLLYRLVTTEKDFFEPSQEDSNNTNSSTSSTAQAGTRLASTLFQSHLKPISPNPGNTVASQSGKQTTRTPVLPEIPRKNASDDK